MYYQKAMSCSRFGVDVVFNFIMIEGMYEWERVSSMYNKGRPDGAPDRDHESIRNRFKYLKAFKNPTGGPTCPPLVGVARAKGIQRLIQNGCGVINVDSNSGSKSVKFDTNGSSQQSAMSDSDESHPGAIVDAFAHCLRMREGDNSMESFLKPWKTMLLSNCVCLETHRLLL
jgi:hypothetical protein